MCIGQHHGRSMSSDPETQSQITDNILLLLPVLIIFLWLR